MTPWCTKQVVYIIAVQSTPLTKNYRGERTVEYKDSTQSFCILSPYIINIYTYTAASYLASLNAFWAWLTWRSTDTLHKSQSIEWVAFEDACKVTFEFGLNRVQ